MPHAACGAWSFTTVGAVVEHVSYQSVSETSGTISPIFGMNLADRGTGGGWVSGGGGFISSRTKEWCRLVARRGDGRTFSTNGGCELALHERSHLFVSHARIGNQEREFLLFNPDSGISQLKVTADDLATFAPLKLKILLWYLAALFFYGLHGKWLAGALVCAAIPSYYIYSWRLDRRKYRATEEQINESVALIKSDFRNRLAHA